MEIKTENLYLAWRNVQWDQLLLKSPVFEITDIKVINNKADDDFKVFQEKLDEEDVALVSCRMLHDKLNESALLEANKFRFIEMTYQPKLTDIHHYCHNYQGALLHVEPAGPGDIEEIDAMITGNFTHERFYMDPLIESGISDQRYINWAKNSLAYETQQPYILRDEKRKAVAFFIVEKLEENTCYWHLNCVSPGMQGRGMGRIAWSTMIDYALKNGCLAIETSISARNFRVMNLYARLGFDFGPPLMTFHWTK